MNDSDAGCRAPSEAIYLFPTGEVRSCCVQTLSLGSAEDQLLSEMWFGDLRNRIADHVAERDYSLGCRTCGDEIATEGAAHAYPRMFDQLAQFGPPRRDEQGRAWPKMLGLYFSNRCNLQCVQCNGESSSSIRRFREGLPPIHTTYSEAFLEDLERFIANAYLVNLVGGEPFATREAFWVLDVVGDRYPHVELAIITNGTYWNSRIESALDRVRAAITVSIDGWSKRTFESIRVGAKRDEVYANLDRFAAYADRARTPLRINFCLMRSNVDEFVDVACHATRLGAHLDVSVVREPEELSLHAASVDEILTAVDELRRGHERNGERLGANAGAVEAEIDRLLGWSQMRQAGSSVSIRSSNKLLGFQVHLDADADSDTFDPDDYLGRLDESRMLGRIGVVLGDRIRDASKTLLERLDVDADAVVGQPVTVLWPLLAHRYGPAGNATVISSDEHVARYSARYGETEFDVHLVARRDSDGRATGADIVILPSIATPVT